MQVMLAQLVTCKTLLTDGSHVDRIPRMTVQACNGRATTAITQRRLARILQVDEAYLSRVLHGKQHSKRLIALYHELVGLAEKQQRAKRRVSKEKKT